MASGGIVKFGPLHPAPAVGRQHGFVRLPCVLSPDGAAGPQPRRSPCCRIGSRSMGGTEAALANGHTRSSAHYDGAEHNARDDPYALGPWDIWTTIANATPTCQTRLTVSRGHQHDDARDRCGRGHTHQCRGDHCQAARGNAGSWKRWTELIRSARSCARRAGGCRSAWRRSASCRRSMAPAPRSLRPAADGSTHRARFSMFHMTMMPGMPSTPEIRGLWATGRNHWPNGT